MTLTPEMLAALKAAASIGGKKSTEKKRKASKESLKKARAALEAKRAKNRI